MGKTRNGLLRTIEAGLPIGMNSDVASTEALRIRTVQDKMSLEERAKVDRSPGEQRSLSFRDARREAEGKINCCQ